MSLIVNGTEIPQTSGNIVYNGTSLSRGLYKPSPSSNAVEVWNVGNAGELTVVQNDVYPLSVVQCFGDSMYHKTWTCPDPVGCYCYCGVSSVGVAFKFTTCNKEISPISFRICLNQCHEQNLSYELEYTVTKQCFVKNNNYNLNGIGLNLQGNHFNYGECGTVIWPSANITGTLSGDVGVGNCIDIPITFTPNSCTQALISCNYGFPVAMIQCQYTGAKFYLQKTRCITGFTDVNCAPHVCLKLTDKDTGEVVYNDTLYWTNCWGRSQCFTY